MQHRLVSDDEWCLELVQPPRQQLAAGSGTTALHEAHVALRHAEPERELQLAQSACLACGDEGTPEGRCLVRHDEILPAMARRQ